MQCALAAHTLYKKGGGKNDCLFLSCMHLTSSACTKIGKKSPRVAIDNIAQPTGRTH